MAELSAEVRALLGARNMAHAQEVMSRELGVDVQTSSDLVATLMPHGSPHVSPVWIAVEGDRLAIFSARENRKVANLRRDGRVAVSVCDEHNPYRSVVVRGRVVEELQGDEAVEIMDRMSNRYVGTDFPMRSAIVSLIEPERVHLQASSLRHRNLSRALRGRPGATVDRDRGCPARPQRDPIRREDSVARAAQAPLGPVVPGIAFHSRGPHRARLIHLGTADTTVVFTE